MDARCENNKKQVRQFIELTWNQGRFNLAKSLVAPEFTYHASMIDQPMNLDIMGIVIQTLRDSIEDFSIGIEEIVAENNQVVTQSVISGTLIKPLMGFEPMDKVVALNAVTFWKLRQGQICSAHSLLDTADMMHQLTRINGQGSTSFELTEVMG